jgi:carbamate kinase
LPYPTQKTAKGYRRVVVSPRPVTIVEKREIRRLIEKDFIVICCGGGGIPVIREGRSFCGVDAVIDKDLASARLAEEVGVDIFVIATDVKGVALNYGSPQEVFLEKLSADEARRYLEAGHFTAGSMAPKIEAALQFTQTGGRRAVICSIAEIEAAVDGSTGTQFR